jgi:hypothetical protein
MTRRRLLRLLGLAPIGAPAAVAASMAADGGSYTKFSLSDGVLPRSGWIPATAIETADHRLYRADELFPDQLVDGYIRFLSPPREGRFGSWERG